MTAISDIHRAISDALQVHDDNMMDARETVRENLAFLP